MFLRLAPLLLPFCVKRKRLPGVRAKLRRLLRLKRARDVFNPVETVYLHYGDGAF